MAEYYKRPKLSQFIFLSSLLLYVLLLLVTSMSWINKGEGTKKQRHGSSQDDRNVLLHVIIQGSQLLPSVVTPVGIFMVVHNQWRFMDQTTMWPISFLLMSHLRALIQRNTSNCTGDLEM